MVRLFSNWTAFLFLVRLALGLLVFLRSGACTLLPCGDLDLSLSPPLLPVGDRGRPGGLGTPLGGGGNRQEE